MSMGVVLDGLTGKPVAESCHAEELVRERAKDDPRFSRVLANMEMSKKLGGAFEPRGSKQTWRETLKTIIASGTQISNTNVETIMVPDFTIPADFMNVERTLKYTLFFDWSTVITTPGTLTLRIRWGGVGGTSLAASGAYAPDPTAASTNISGSVDWYVVCRTQGTAGSMFTMGRVFWQDYDDASATSLKGNLDMFHAPVSAPAVVSSLDTTTAKALSPTATFSVSTSGTNLQTHIGILEVLN